MDGRSTCWPVKAGVPLHPEQNGAHMLTHAMPDPPIPGPWFLLWCGPEHLWTDIFGNRFEPEQMAPYRYVGPMTPPAEWDAIRTAWRARCVAGADAATSPAWCGYPEARHEKRGCWSLLAGLVTSPSDCRACECCAAGAPTVPPDTRTASGGAVCGSGGGVEG